MKTLPWLICAVAVALLNGCVSQDTSKLHVGMTRDEVIKLMGSPDAEVPSGIRVHMVYHLMTGNRPSTSQLLREANRDQLRTTYTNPVTGQTFQRIPASDIRNSLGAAPVYHGKRNTQIDKYFVVLTAGKVSAFGYKRDISGEM